MAGTLATLLFEVRRLIGDRRKGDPVVTDPFLEELADLAVAELSDEMGLGQTKTTGFVTLTAGTSTYTVTLPTSIPGILHLQSLVVESNAYPLARVTLEELLAMRINLNQARGTPLFYAYRESAAQAVTLEIHPAPVAADALTAYWEAVHKRVTTGGTVANTDTLSLSDYGLKVLRARVAGKCILALAPEALARLNPPKSPTFGQDLLAQSVRLAEAEGFRLHAGALPDTVERTR